MKNKLPYLFSAIIFIIIYRFGSFSKIPFGDCVSQVFDVEKGNYILETFSTAHFLYINSLILLSKILPFIENIELIRWFVILSAVFSLLIFQKTAKLLFGSTFYALVGTFIFGLSFTLWRSAEIVEVYTYNLLFFMLFTYFLVKSIIQNSNYFIGATIFLGISFWIHVLNILFIPGFIIVCFYFFKSKPKQLFLNLFLLIIFFGGLYVIPIMNGLPVKGVLSSNESSWVEDSLTKSIMDYIKDILKSIFYIVYNFWYFTPFIFWGAFKLYKNNQKLFLLTIILLAPVMGFSTIYAVSDNYVFFLHGYVILVLLIVYGLIQAKKVNKKLITIGIIIIPFLYLLNFKFIIKTSVGQKIQTEKSYKGGLSYYAVPWISNNVGILEFIIENRKAPEPMHWMEDSAKKIIKFYQSQGLTLEEIKKK